MVNKRARPEDIITKLRQVGVLMGQGHYHQCVVVNMHPAQRR